VLDAVPCRAGRATPRGDRPVAGFCTTGVNLLKIKFCSGSGKNTTMGSNLLSSDLYSDTLPTAPRLPYENTILDTVLTILYYTILSYAVLCCAVLCCAVLCCALLFSAVLCCAVLGYAMLCYAMLCYDMLCYAILYYTILYYILYTLYYTYTIPIYSNLYFPSSMSLSPLTPLSPHLPLP
jgi:hypothetical protein